MSVMTLQMTCGISFNSDASGGESGDGGGHSGSGFGSGSASGSAMSCPTNPKCKQFYAQLTLLEIDAIYFGLNECLAGDNLYSMLMALMMSSNSLGDHRVKLLQTALRCDYDSIATITAEECSALHNLEVKCNHQDDSNDDGTTVTWCDCLGLSEGGGELPAFCKEGFPSDAHEFKAACDVWDDDSVCPGVLGNHSLFHCQAVGRMCNKTAQDVMLKCQSMPMMTEKCPEVAKNLPEYCPEWISGGHCTQMGEEFNANPVLMQNVCSEFNSITKGCFEATRLYNEVEMCTGLQDLCGQQGSGSGCGSGSQQISERNCELLISNSENIFGGNTGTSCDDKLKDFPEKNINECSCKLDLTWKDLTNMLQQDESVFVTGGLGKRMTENEFEVWICMKNNECTYDPHNPMCFVYDEQDKKFLPWAHNDDLKLFAPSDFTRRSLTEVVWKKSKSWSVLKKDAHALKTTSAKIARTTQKPLTLLSKITKGNIWSVLKMDANALKAAAAEMNTRKTERTKRSKMA